MFRTLPPAPPPALQICSAPLICNAPPLTAPLINTALLLCTALLLWTGPASAQAHRYDLRATLDPWSHSVSGEATIRWTNESALPASELLFHLYLNAFESRESVFMTESDGQLRGDRFQGEGSIELLSLTLDGADLLEGADDELTPNDRTQLRVPLATPVPPGESIEIEARFLSSLPPVFARSGYAGDFHMVAQWFPKLARREPDGTWASFPYHGHGEFYADFAEYTLEVQAPPGWKVGATGDAVDTESGSVHRFEASQVHDCAFAAAPWFVETRTPVRVDERDVLLRVLAPPGYGSASERVVEITRAGLAHYGSLYGTYPYDTLTVIVPPADAPGAAGMEYPMLFVTAGPWFSDRYLPFEAPLLFQDHVTAHELGHQWFQGMVASNEVAWPMLDEGLTEWITTDLLREEYGQGSAFRLPFASIPVFSIERLGAFRGKHTPPPGRPAHAFSGAAYGRSVYMGSTSIFETVARTWGLRRFRRALGAYARASRFHHPVPDDLFRAMDAEYGEWMSRRILRPALMHGATAPRALRVDQEQGRFVIRGVRGGLPLPTSVRVRTSAGSQDFPWPGRSDRFELVTDEAPLFVSADPDEHSMLDPTRRDDAWSNEGHGYFARALFVLQSLAGISGP